MSTIDNTIPVINTYESLLAEEGKLNNPQDQTIGFSVGSYVMADVENFVHNNLQSYHNVFCNAVIDYLQEFTKQIDFSNKYIISKIGQVSLEFNAKYREQKVINNGIYEKLLVDDTEYNTADYPELAAKLQVTSDTFKLSAFIDCYNKGGNVLITLANNNSNVLGSFKAGEIGYHTHLEDDHQHDASHNHSIEGPEQPLQATSTVGTSQYAAITGGIGRILYNLKDKGNLTNETSVWQGNTTGQSKTSVDNTGEAKNIISSLNGSLYIVAKVIYNKIPQPEQPELFTNIWASSQTNIQKPDNWEIGFKNHEVISSAEYNYLYKTLQENFNSLCNAVYFILYTQDVFIDVVNTYNKGAIGTPYIQYYATQEVPFYNEVASLHIKDAQDYSTADYIDFTTSWDITGDSFNLSSIFNLNQVTSIAIDNANMLTTIKGEVISHTHANPHEHDATHSHVVKIFLVNENGNCKSAVDQQIESIKEVQPNSKNFNTNANEVVSSSSNINTQLNTTTITNASDLNVASGISIKLNLIINSKPYQSIYIDRTYDIADFPTIWASMGKVKEPINATVGFENKSAIPSQTINYLIQKYQLNYNSLVAKFLQAVTLKNPLQDLAEREIGNSFMLSYNQSDKIYNDEVFTWLKVDDTEYQTVDYPELVAKLQVTTDTFKLTDYMLNGEFKVDGNVALNMFNDLSVNLGTYNQGSLKPHIHKDDHTHKVTSHNHAIGVADYSIVGINAEMTVYGQESNSTHSTNVEKANLILKGNSNIQPTGSGSAANPYNMGDNVCFNLYICAKVNI